MKYRKRPVVVEAVKWAGTEESANEIISWATEHDGGLYYARYTSAGGGDVLVVSTLEGDMRARPGDYIIRGVQNEFYPCAADIFEQTYEPA